VTDERRAAPRHEAYLAGELETASGRSGIAITRDITPTGILVLTRIQLTVGEKIKMTVVLGDARHQLTGTVIRHEEIELGELWRHKLAIVLDGTDAELAKLYATLDAKN
jgi:hypothetical protein